MSVSGRLLDSVAASDPPVELDSADSDLLLVTLRVLGLLASLALDFLLLGLLVASAIVFVAEDSEFEAVSFEVVLFEADFGGRDEVLDSLLMLSLALFIVESAATSAFFPGRLACSSVLLSFPLAFFIADCVVALSLAELESDGFSGPIN